LHLQARRTHNRRTDADRNGRRIAIAR